MRENDNGEHLTEIVIAFPVVAKVTVSKDTLMRWYLDRSLTTEMYEEIVGINYDSRYIEDVEETVMIDHFDAMTGFRLAHVVDPEMNAALDAAVKERNKQYLAEARKDIKKLLEKCNNE
jgi:hypothetical protein